MGKKKNRQPDVVDDVNGDNNTQLSESSEEANTGEVKCQHIRNSVNLSFLRKVFKKKGIDESCGMCKTKNIIINNDDNEDGYEKIKQPLWICLQCGHQACGRSDHKHAEEHYKTPHSISHSLAMDTHYFKIHCYECDGDVNSSSTKQLLEIVEFVKKMLTTSHAPPQPPIPLPYMESISSDASVINNKIDKQLMNNFTRVGGLQNLGNTCFFNSVLQCLAQTPYLVKVLQNLRDPGEKFILSGGNLKFTNENNKESDEQILPPIEGSLDGWGEFTSILTKTLIDMQNSSDNSSHRPSELIYSFKKHTTQCMDGGQHDAHELLRHLLEIVRNEDLKRYQAIILKELGLDAKKYRQNIDAKQKAQVKYYGNQASARLLGPEPVFRGELVLTLECLYCKHSSQRTEPFLDLSLPVMVDKPQPPQLKRKNSSLEDNNLDLININIPSNSVPSKHQLKKEAKLAGSHRRNRRRQRANMNNTNNNEESSSSDINFLEENNADKNNSEEDDESDADVEDNAESEVATISSVIESGYSSEKTAHLSPTELTTVSPLNSLVNKNTTFSEAETDECRSSPEIEHPICESSIVNEIDEVTTGISKISMTNHRISSSPTRYPTKEGDFSIQSCLNQFTTLELMSGSNKVACEACTARENKKNPGNNASSKMVCTPSSMQYLISRVPPVLILHLKRFQSQRYGGFRKVNKHVTFPMVLDLAPVCKNHNKPKLYSLFGVVEHSGTLHGGHYVAYVKTRQPLAPDDSRWSFLPKKSDGEEEKNKKCNDSDTESRVEQNTKTTVEPPPGKWYYVSDSRVVPQDEATVLKKEAYLLFYERIL